MNIPVIECFDLKLSSRTLEKDMKFGKFFLRINKALIIDSFEVFLLPFKKVILVKIYFEQFLSLETGTILEN